MGDTTHTHTHTHTHTENHTENQPYYEPRKDWLYPLRNLVDAIPVKNGRFAHLICQTIPCCCPFEQDLNLFGRTFHVPALCKLNPLYDNFVGLRFRALSYLVDVSKEDVTKYIC